MQEESAGIAGNVRLRGAEIHPFRTLVTLVVGASIAVLLLLSSVADGRAPDRHPGLSTWFRTAAADSDSLALDLSMVSDTDSVALNMTAAADTDSVAVDASSLADTTVGDTLQTPRADFYIPRRRRDNWLASPVQRQRRPLYPRLGNYWQHEVALDSTEEVFTVRESVGNIPVRDPLSLTYEEYRQHRLETSLNQGWRDVMVQRQRQRQHQQRGGLGFNIVVPGGQQSAFTTIFGKPTVDLRVNGQADIKAGFNYRKSDQQVAVTGRAAQMDPDFKQDLRLGITGTIGDKLRVDVNWDTNNQFDFQNQLRLQYTGYEDEIIQNVEAGNVHLSTPSRLIRGGQSLFGIKSQFQLGGLQLTTVASQQEGQSNSLSIDGGSQTTPIDIQPTDYDDNTHYFLGYYFRNRWEEALSEPPTVIVGNGFEQITDIQVWKMHEGLSPEDEDIRNVIAVVDLGEEPQVVSLADNYLNEELPSDVIDRYDETSLSENLREGTASPQEYLKEIGLGDNDFQEGPFKLLRLGADYEFDRVLGYISLNQRLQEGEALAVSYRYRAGGQTFTVGDFSTETGGSAGGLYSDRLVLKLLKPVQLSQPAQNLNPAAWYLELRNIYRLPGRGLQPNDFELQIEHQPPGNSGSKVVPDLTSTGRQTLLQLLGLDRLNVDEALQPDDQFDYLGGFTIDPQDGELVFPYLEPFGDRISEIIDGLDISDADKQARKEEYVFSSLYTKKKELARRETRYDVYYLRGSYRGSVQDFYDLRAYAGLIEGSVVVTSGGSRLTEGADYTVDYQGGTVQITNPAYLSAGRGIEISYEQNSFFNLQKKTLLGARADYIFNDKVALGGTLFSLNQKSPIDKYRIGEEPISNTIWGVDGAVDFQPQWLTRAIDFLPFIQTKAPSSIQITGEFAQLRPGASQTVAFERTRRDLRDDGRDFKTDELQGISYLDDFEGFENTFSLRQPGAWRLASAPDSLRLYPGTQQGAVSDSLRSNWRGVFGWYTLNDNVLADLSGGTISDLAVAPVPIKDVFPNRDTQGDTHPYLQPLDVYFTPHQRGPYNYTRNLKGFLESPKDVWGGMMQRLPQGYNDFTVKNIEFIEFVVKVFPKSGSDVGRDAKLYVDLGSISEDVIPNGVINTEDGLSLTEASPRNIDEWSRITSGTLNSTIDVDDESRRTEDLGLDGLASYSTGEYDPLMTEQVHFQDFLNSLDQNDSDPRYQTEVNKALQDPSGDDFFYFESDQYFEDPTYYPGGASIQERFTKYFPGTEINSFEAQNKLASSLHGQRGNSRIPDSEDLNSNSAVELANNYYQYELPLSRAVIDSMAAPDKVDDYVVTEITEGGGWYQVRIPVRDFSRHVGDIQDFSNIESIRVWATGFDAPVTVRFATFELVGSQWQKSETITLEREVPSDTVRNDTRLSVSSINNEENTDTYVTPRGTIISQNRLATGQAQRSREQAMVLRVENLMPGKHRAIFKTYNQGLDLLKYSNLRMFAHMHGDLGSGAPIESRDKVRLFLRLGANETNDYYEYELPLTPSPATSNDADVLWQTHQNVNGRTIDLNSINLVLGALNQLKVARDEASAPRDSVYWTDEHQVALSPTLEDFAPPGTRLGIKGTPSLGRINTLIIGIRNPADSTISGAPNRDPDDILEDVTVWVNEMRVSGYDETNGWAAMANADIRLADLGTIRASWRSQTDGFGGLESTLGEREQTNLANWSVTTDVNLDKFIPARFGWTIPFSVQIQSNTSTPRFAPNRGDIRLEELVSQIDENDTLTEAERAQRREEAIEAAQTASRTHSFNTRIQKSGSDSKLLRNTLDGLSFNYSYSNNDSRGPSQRLSDNWRWNTTLNYRLNIRRPRTVKPFWFLEKIPILGVLGGLDFNYVPQSLSAGATAARNFTASKERPRLTPGQVSELPEAVQYPLRQTHALSHRRNMSLQYNPFQFLNLSYDANTNQSLNAMGVDTLFSVVVRGDDGSESLHQNLRVEDATDVLGLDTTQTPYQITELRVVPTDQIINRIYNGAEGLRTDQHNERFTASFRPNLGQIKALNWISLQDVVYGSQYSWKNGSLSRPTGASVSNSLEIRGGVTLRPQELFRKIPFYTSLEEAEEQYRAEQEAERKEREQQREALKRQREQREKAREEARERGEELPEEQPEAADTSATEDEGGWVPDFLPNPVSLLRRTALAITGIRDFSITYSQNQSASSSNVGRGIYQNGGVVDVETPYSLFDALLGNGPPVGYRFGFDRHVPLDQRIIDDRFQVTDVLRDGHQIQGRTSLNPSQALQINLNWNANWDDDTNLTYRREDDLEVRTTETSTGQNRASIWAFRANYLDLFERQLDTYRDDAAADQTPDNGELGDENGDGRVALTNQSIVSDFQQTYLSGLGTVDAKGLLPFPMPNWQVTYSGIGNWPIIRGLVASATLRHGYSSDYGTNYRVQTLSSDSMRAFPLGDQSIIFSIPRNDVGGLRVNERFQPLIGVDFSFKGRLQTSIAWNKSTSYSLSTTNFEVAENATSEMTFTASYQRQGMKLPFFKKLNNRINLSLTVSRATLSDQRFLIRRALVDYLTRPDFVVEDALSTEYDNVSVISASTRVTVVPRISYQFSNRVSADFTLRYENFASEDSRQPSSTTINGGFNVRVSIAN